MIYIYLPEISHRPSSRLREALGALLQRLHDLLPELLFFSQEGVAGQPPQEALQRGVRLPVGP